MGNVWGKNIQISIFGESHGAAVGITIAQLPAGFAIDWEQVEREMARRAPGQALSTQRKESDKPEILSGWFQGKTTGTPLCMLIRNEDTRSRDYNPNLMRPGHADLAAQYKYNGFADYRGGGHFSGRLTAPLVLAGAIAKQILQEKNITIGAHIAQIHQTHDSAMAIERIVDVSQKPFPVYDKTAADLMQKAIMQAREEKDSLGGVIECAALGVPGGWGDPFFDSLESTVAGMIFSIPAVKGIEFGDGFALAQMKGSEANDSMFWNGQVQMSSNHNGGINGGISNSMPVVFRVAIKPTPTIGREQTTVDMDKRETVTHTFGGRHDPCIVLRAVPVVEAALALCLLDVSMDN